MKINKNLLVQMLSNRLKNLLTIRIFRNKIDAEITTSLAIKLINNFHHNKIATVKLNLFKRLKIKTKIKNFNLKKNKN